MSWKHQTAIRNAIEVGLRPIPGGMRADWQPEASAAPQQESENQPGHTGVEGSDPGFAAVEDMTGPKEKRKTEGGRPKADAGSKRKLRVPAISKLFFQANNHKHEPIQGSPSPRLNAVQGDAGDVECSGRAHNA